MGTFLLNVHQEVAWVMGGGAQTPPGKLSIGSSAIGWQGAPAINVCSLSGAGEYLLPSCTPPWYPILVVPAPKIPPPFVGGGPVPGDSEG
jgi:hypothetical protein